MQAEQSPLLVNEPAAGAAYQELSPISLAHACSCLGHFLDLWHTDPQKLFELLKQGLHVATEHPLRGLCFPKAQPPEPGVKQGIVSGGASEFTPGQRVKVRLGAEVKERMGRFEKTADERFTDTSKEWGPATVVAKNPDGTVEVTWDCGYKRDRFHAAENIEPSESGTGIRSAVEHVVDTMGQSGRLSCATVLRMLCIAVGVACVPQLLATAFGKHPCSDEIIDTFPLTHLCTAEVDSFANSGGGLVIGMGILAVNCACAFLVLPCTYACMRRCCPVTAKRVRQSFEAVVLDPIRIRGLPTMYGFAETLTIVFFISLNISGLLMACVTLDPGLFPLTSTLAQYFLIAMNAVFGEKSGFKDLRKNRLMAILEEQLQATKSKLSKEELRFEVDRLLGLPTNAGVIHCSVEMVALVASLCPVERPDPVRTRFFAVERAYAEYDHPVHKPQAMRRKHDVLVDVFAGECEVPGLTLVGERWRKCGEPLAWHLAVQESFVRPFEVELQERGLPAGAGCFTWHSWNGIPASFEARDPSALQAQIEALRAQQNGRDLAMSTVCGLDSLADDPELVQIFLRAGANVNFAEPPPVFRRPLDRAALAGKAKTIALLCEARADLSTGDATTGTTPLHLAIGQGHAEAAKTLMKHGADVAAKNKKGRAPLELTYPQSRPILDEMRAFAEELERTRAEGRQAAA